MPKLYKNVVLWDAERESASLCDVLTEGAEIAKIAPAGTLCGEAAFDGRGGTAMLPGFVNAHGHAAMTMLRGLGEELPLMEWLQKKIWPVENKLDAETAYIGAQLALMEMLSTGTTCFADMYFFMDSVAEAVLAGGMRAGLSRGIVPSLLAGGFLGVCSSFLGIGGGPINVALIIYLFSYDTKTATICSLVTILLAQVSKLCSVAFTTGFAVYDLSIAPVMVIGAVAGGFLGASLNKYFSEKAAWAESSMYRVWRISSPAAAPAAAGRMEVGMPQVCMISQIIITVTMRTDCSTS